MDNKQVNFEESLKRLDEVVNRIENETLPLEETLALYEEAKKLIKLLEGALKDAEKKVEELQK